MTRPFLSSHRSAGKTLAYISGRDARSAAPEMLGGTVQWRGFPHTIAHLKRLPLPQQLHGRFLHITLSPPARLQLSDVTLLGAVDVMFRSLGLPSRAMPWLAFRHRSTDCHHIHILAVPMTFSGQPLPLQNRKRLCEEADIKVSRFLGLERPRYPERRSGPRITPILPGRRLEPPGRREIADAVVAAFENSQPVGLDALRTALAALPGGVDVELV